MSVVKVSGVRVSWASMVNTSGVSMRCEGGLRESATAAPFDTTRQDVIRHDATGHNTTNATRLDMT